MGVQRSMTNPEAFPLWKIIAYSRGGPTRVKIIKILKDKPQNTHQLSKLLKVDYKTVRYHIDILKKNKIIVSADNRYGAVHFLSQTLEDNYAIVEVASAPMTGKRRTNLPNLKHFGKFAGKFA